MLIYKKNLLLKIIFSIMVALFVFQTEKGNFFYFFPFPKGKAHWIHPQNKGPCGVFRYKLYLAQKPYICWLQISSTDEYKLYINGKSIDEKVFYSENPSGLYNLTPFLQAGLNIIGITVRRWSFPGPPMILVRGGLKYTPNSPYKYFYSNESWRALNHEDKKGRIWWGLPIFNDDHWPYAKVVKDNTPKPYPLFFPIQSISIPLKGSILSSSTSSKGGSFEGEFYLKEKKRLPFFLRINASHPFELVINSFPLGTFYPINKLDIIQIPSSIFYKGLNKIKLVFHSSNLIIPYFYLDIIIPYSRNSFDKITSFKWKFFDSFHKEFEVFPTKKATFGSLYNLNFTFLNVENLPIKFYFKPLIYALISLIIVFIFSLKLSSNIQYSFYLSIFYFLFLFILNFDIRFSSFEIFNFYNILIGLFLFLSLLIIEIIFTSNNILSSIKNISIKEDLNNKKLFVYFLLLSFLIICGYLRIRDIGFISLNGDEIGTIRFALNTLKRGFPYIQLGNLWKPATTYELLPYPIALMLLIFKNPSEFIVRLPSFIFSLMTLSALFLIALRLFSLRTALIVSLIYTLSPLEINMAQNARYIQIEQFWSLLTIFCYFIGIKDSEMNIKYLYLSAIFFSFGYLFWEGFGYILPSLCITTFLVKWNDWKWIKSWHLWAAATICSLVVLIQLAYRTYWSLSYLVVGSGISDSTFKFMPLYQSYDPWYYFKVLFFNQYNFLSFLIIIFLILFIIKEKSLRFFLSIILCVSILLANTFSLYTSRYIYFLQPIFILLVIGAIDKAFSKKLIFYLLSFIILISSNDYFLKLYKLSANPFPESPQGLYLRPIVEMRHNIYQVDFKGCNNYVKNHLLDDDIIISVYSHPTLFYVGKLDYFLQSITDTQIICLDDDYPKLVNKTVAVPTIRSLAELKEVLKRAKRAWFVLTSYELFTLINNQKIINFVNNNAKSVYESYRCRIFLWEKRNIQ